MNFEKLFSQFKETNLFGRYITLKDIEPLLDKFNIFVYKNRKILVILK